MERVVVYACTRPLRQSASETRSALIKLVNEFHGMGLSLHPKIPPTFDHVCIIIVSKDISYNGCS
jgi:hypothetical protein